MGAQVSSRSGRMTIIGGGLAVALAIGAVVLFTRNDDAPVGTVHPGGDEPTVGAVPEIPAFGFTKATREVVRTVPGPLKQRQRAASNRAAIAARTILDHLYTEGFLDPANWKEAAYADAFEGFARGARERAEARLGLLTAGARAGERYEQILPVVGRIDTRILLDRSGRPTLVLSAVRFAAAATGPEPATLRSSGQFFFERVHGSWKIVSFHVTRTDEPREAS